MLSKSELRARLVYMRKYIKLSVLAKEFGLSHATLSKFLSNEVFDYMISHERINEFYNFTLDNVKNIT